MLTGSTGTGNTTILRIRDSHFSGCNNGLSILSGVNLMSNLLGGVTTQQPPADLLGADGLMDIEISNTRFVDNAASNIVLGVIAGLRELKLKVESSDFSRGGENAVALRKVYLGEVENATIDFGGGALGSAGGNCILDAGTHDVLSEGFAASLQLNWWGQASGPDPARLSAASADSLNTHFPLATAPAICSE